MPNANNQVLRIQECRRLAPRERKALRLEAETAKARVVRNQGLKGEDPSSDLCGQAKQLAPRSERVDAAPIIAKKGSRLVLTAIQEQFVGRAVAFAAIVITAGTDRQVDHAVEVQSRKNRLGLHWSVVG